MKAPVKLSQLQTLKHQALSTMLVLVGFVFFTGCAMRSENRIHLAVADVDSTNSTLKFYRVTVKAKSSNKNAALQTGFFDANAVRDLFGEVKKPETSNESVSIKGGSSIGSYSFRYDPATERWELIPPNHLFTILFGADAKALAQVIKTYASSDETGVLLGRLLAGTSNNEVAVEAISAEQMSEQMRAKAQDLASAIKAANDKISSTTIKPDELAQELLKIAQRSVSNLGSGVMLGTDPTNGFVQAEAVYQTLTQSK